MIKNILSLAVFLLFYGTLFSQELPPESAKAPNLNNNGDPLTNILDPDGFQQGSWFYTDVYNNDLVRKQFESNSCIAIDYNYNGNWVNAASWEQDELLIASIKTEIEGFLSQQQVVLDLQTSKQLVLLFDEQGNLNTCAPVGLWNLGEATALKNEIQTLFSDFKLKNIKNETFILL